MQDTALQLMGYRRNLLRGDKAESRDLLVNCLRVCVGFAPGTCIWLYPTCRGYRNLNGNDVGMNDETVPMNDVIDEQNINDRDLLLSQISTSYATSKCDFEETQAKLAINEMLKGTISTSCAKLLSRRITLKCVA